MRYDWLLEPISAEAPCGPDLDEIGDEKYLNYVLPVASRIPPRFYKADTDEPVDRSAIKLKEELPVIADLLKQSRDIRLLCIEARLQSFAGDLSGFADCITAVAGLVERFWEDVHPKAFEGDFTLRQNVLSGLDDWWQIIQPLQHLPLVRDKRADLITFRQVAVATGATPKRASETAVDLAEIHRALSAAENRAASDASFKAITDAAAGLASIRNSFTANAGYEYVPSFDKLVEFLASVITLFQAARPELAAAAPGQEPAAEAGDQSSEAAGPDGAAAAGNAAAKPAALKGLIKSQAEAAAALLAVETYFAANEPSSPALILVHQARALVGKPLTHSLEILLPEAAPRAIIRIQGDLNLQLNMTQLKQLTADVPKAAEAANGAGASPNVYSAASRAEAMTLMAEVEQFYKAAEPSSPVPMLLAKASSFSNSDFKAILKDLIAPPA
jgi:type VI secretion system protein ImpA